MPFEAEPLIKWAGGKRLLISTIAPAILHKLGATGGRYFEPFLGGASVALHLGLPRMVLNDANAELMTMYRTVRSDPASVAWMLSALGSRGVDEAAYYSVRDERPVLPAMIAARMLYLNRLGYNGMYRVNADGGFNVPAGADAKEATKLAELKRQAEANVPYAAERYRESVVKRKSRDSIGSLFPHKGKFEALAAAFATSDLRDGDFEPVIDDAQTGDLIYADSPYDETYDSYTAAGFAADDQLRLANALARARTRGVTIMASNADTPLVRSLYPWATIINTSERRSVNSDVAGRGRAPCVLIVSDS